MCMYKCYNNKKKKQIHEITIKSLNVAVMVDF